MLLRLKMGDAFNPSFGCIIDMCLVTVAGYFPLQMCTPLLLMERFNLVEAYVAGYPELQTKLLQMLDRWSLSRFNPRKLSRYEQTLFLYFRSVEKADSSFSEATIRLDFLSLPHSLSLLLKQDYHSQDLVRISWLPIL